MHFVDIQEAETRLASLLEMVERGEQFVIARAGRPIAILSAYRPARQNIAPPGSMKGRDWFMRDDFDAPVHELFSCLAVPDGTAPSPAKEAMEASVNSPERAEDGGLRS
jgi:antitoxin (DNA-binding transcriptional repressor) of toxin-antitoxin stability system